MCVLSTVFSDAEFLLTQISQFFHGGILFGVFPSIVYVVTQVSQSVSGPRWKFKLRQKRFHYNISISNDCTIFPTELVCQTLSSGWNISNLKRFNVWIPNILWLLHLDFIGSWGILRCLNYKSVPAFAPQIFGPIQFPIYRDISRRSFVALFGIKAVNFEIE